MRIRKPKEVTTQYYVLVQHSGYGYGGNPQFVGGLETRTVSAKLAEKLALRGARVYSSYPEAHEAEYRLMYPENYGGLTPVADRAGTFLTLKVDGLRVFVERQALAA